MRANRCTGGWHTPRAPVSPRRVSGEREADCFPLSLGLALRPGHPLGWPSALSSMHTLPMSSGYAPPAPIQRSPQHGSRARQGGECREKPRWSSFGASLEPSGDVAPASGISWLCSPRPVGACDAPCDSRRCDLCCDRGPQLGDSRQHRFALSRSWRPDV